MKSFCFSNIGNNHSGFWAAPKPNESSVVLLAMFVLFIGCKSQSFTTACSKKFAPFVASLQANSFYASF